MGGRRRSHVAGQREGAQPEGQAGRERAGPEPLRLERGAGAGVGESPAAGRPAGVGTGSRSLGRGSVGEPDVLGGCDLACRYLKQ